MKIIHNVTLDVSRKGIQCSVPVTQHDSGTHRLVIRLRNGMTPLKPEEGDGAVVYLGKDMYDPVTVYTSEGAYPNCLVYDVTPYATSEAGEQTAVLQLYRAADGIVYSPQFTLFVREDVTGGSLVLSSPQYAAVVKAQNASEIYAERAENAERSANTSEEAASESAAIAAEAQARAVSVGEHIDECLGENGEKLEFVKNFAQSDVPEIKGRLESAENTLGAYEGDDGLVYPELETENPAVIPALNELLKRLLSLNGEVAKKAEATDPVTGGAFSHAGDFTATGEVRAESVGANTVTAGKIGADSVTAAELVGNVRAETVNAVRLNVTGTATVKDYEEIAVRDSVLVLNSDGEDVSGAYSGIVIRADGDSAYAILLDGSSRTVRLGYGRYDTETNSFAFASGDGGAVLTRDDSGEMTDGGMLYWDAEANRARQAALDAATAEKLYGALKDVGLSDYNGRYLGVDNGELKLISAGKLVSVASIEQTTVSDIDGGVNIATVTLTDGTQSALRIRNGSKGEKGEKGEKGDAGEGLEKEAVGTVSEYKVFADGNSLIAGIVGVDGSISSNASYLRTDYIDLSLYESIRLRIKSFTPVSETSERLFWMARFDKNKQYIEGSREYAKMYSLTENGDISANTYTSSNLAYIGTVGGTFEYGMGKDYSVSDYGDGTQYIVFFNLRYGDTVDMTVGGIVTETKYKYVVPYNSLPAELTDGLKAVERFGGYIPMSEYVDELIENVALAAKAHMKEDSLCITLFTDTHYTENDTCFPTEIAKRLAQATNSAAIVHLGDLAHMATEDKNIGLKLWQRHGKILQMSKIPYLQAVGNHDDGNIYLHNVTGNYFSENYLKASDLYFATAKQSRNDITGMGSVRGWYYLDDEDSKVRLIMLNSHDYPWIENDDGTIKYDSNAKSSIMAVYSPEQLLWLANTALDFSDKGEDEGKWSALVFAHMGTSNWANVNVLLQDFKNGVKCTRFGGYSDSYGIYDYSDLQSSLTNDFSRAGGRKTAFLLGDVHWDKVSTSSGYPAVQFLNASLAKDQDIAPVKTKGAPTETAVSVLVVTPSEGKITELRFGAGTKDSGAYDPLTDYDNYRVIEF